MTYGPGDRASPGGTIGHAGESSKRIWGKSAAPGQANGTISRWTPYNVQSALHDGDDANRVGKLERALGAKHNFKKFFFRGLGILLPSVLTIWLLVAAYQFVQGRIAVPINQGVKHLIVLYSPFPIVTEQEMIDHQRDVEADKELRQAYRDSGNDRNWLRQDAKRAKFGRFWDRYALFLDLIGLFIAMAMIYAVGLFLGSFIGRRLYHRGEVLIHRLPLVRRVYPSMKQVTDFFFGDTASKLQFNRVVAVEYPRKGLWSVGLVTGDTMRDIQHRANAECLTVFVPSSPTPFTGYVITVPKVDTIDLNVTIEDALKFAVSGGVLIPPSQQIHPDHRLAPSANDNGSGEASKSNVMTADGTHGSNDDLEDQSESPSGEQVKSP